MLSNLIWEEKILGLILIAVLGIAIYLIVLLIDSFFYITRYANGTIVEKKIETYQPAPILVQTGSVTTMLPQPPVTDHILIVNNKDERYRVVADERYYNQLKINDEIKVKINTTLFLRNSFYYYSETLNKSD